MPDGVHVSFWLYSYLLFSLETDICGCAVRIGLMTVIVGRSLSFAALRREVRGGSSHLFLHWKVWMSHGDKLTRIPAGFIDLASTANSEHAIIADVDRLIYGMQFHPEVSKKKVARKMTDRHPPTHLIHI